MFRDLNTCSDWIHTNSSSYSPDASFLLIPHTYPLLLILHANFTHQAILDDWQTHNQHCTEIVKSACVENPTLPRPDDVVGAGCVVRTTGSAIGVGTDSIIGALVSPLPFVGLSVDVSDGKSLSVVDG